MNVTIVFLSQKLSLLWVYSFFSLFFLEKINIFVNLGGKKTEVEIYLSSDLTTDSGFRLFRSE
jgi:hypothetical protein